MINSPHYNPEHYRRRITSKDKALITFLNDISGSMDVPPAGCPGLTKAEALADAVNSTTQRLFDRCPARDDGSPKYYFDVGYLNYDDLQGCVPVFTKPILSMDELKKLCRMEDRLVVNSDGTKSKRRVPTWIAPKATTGTPMSAAFRKLHGYLADWVKLNPNNPAPSLIHTSDGASGDGDPSLEMARCRSLATRDGNLLLFNVHISEAGTAGKRILFPRDDKELADDNGRMLFANSSYLTPAMIEVLRQMKYDVDADSRAFVFNATVQDLIMALTVGTPTP